MIITGDALDVLRGMPENTVDSIVCDPPAGISFMSQKWDGDHGGRDQWVDWLTSIMREAYRVLKPGGHGLVWAIPRTSHWTAFALEDAGFEIRDRVSHLFGSGFPKSLNIGKAIDKAAGAKRETVGSYKVGGNAAQSTAEKGGTYASGTDSVGVAAIDIAITKPATPEAEEWDGWGTALKPAVEDWWLVRKPITEKTVAKNVVKNGTGALNIDGCRVEGDMSEFINPNTGKPRSGVGQHYSDDGEYGGEKANPPHVAGRWPANLVLSHSRECVCIGTADVKANPSWNDNRGPSSFTGEETSPVVHGDGETETVQKWECVEGCPVRELDAQSGSSKSPPVGSTCNAASPSMFRETSMVEKSNGYGDTGGASRYFNTFFYTAKASRKEREAGCDSLPLKTGGELTDREDGSAGLNSPRAGAGRGGGRRNSHPTVKPIALCKWLVRLITPPGGVVLDPFMGSGSTGVAALLEGFRFIGIELSEEYSEIARARIEHAERTVGNS